eukprot:Polyplicarium_translucidae@DN2705_c0_g1_i3.p1
MRPLPDTAPRVLARHETDLKAALLRLWKCTNCGERFGREKAGASAAPVAGIGTNRRTPSRSDYFRFRATDMHPLATKSILSALVWTAIHAGIGDGLLLRCVPAKTRSAVEARKRSDADLRGALLVNGVAFIHACLTVPLGIYGAFFCTSLREDKFNGTNPATDFMFVVMLGYFLWDSAVCIWHYRSFGMTFLLHGVICFVSLYVQQVATTDRLNWYLCALALSEASTPFLHIRYVLLKGKATSTRLFTFANTMFLALFVSVRLIAIPSCMTGPLLKELVFSSARTPNMSAARRTLIVTDYVFWLFLNFFWATQLARSQWKQFRLSGGRKETESGQK